MNKTILSPLSFPSPFIAPKCFQNVREKRNLKRESHYFKAELKNYEMHNAQFITQSQLCSTEMLEALHSLITNR